eukprot:CAMPEP_0196819364 /NCGR_PEP_ID=MMETSP1362-20130617/70229_1 /TAXON_ID=163516 /ORGANISM="Leptocylindrus danicus, Strain CCMP1856" /LENGTH=67 /DNA_ID=CAMNT_0042197821 /DNA_START=52 /DNA_END=252 /DNA_ORIENTATION=-
MTCRQLTHATIDKDTRDFQEPEYIGNNESPEDVKTLNQVAAVEEDDLPDDDAVSWTEYVGSGDIESP